MNEFLIENLWGDALGFEQADTWIKQAANTTIKTVSPVDCYGENWAVGLRVSNNDDVQALNKQFRGKDKPTNVLSFPADTEFTPKGEQLYLGDIIFAAETVANEASEQNKSLENHLKHLTIHGLLHIFGYDHMNDSEAEIMESLEISILKSLNISNPY